jgi:hypothetical protein
VRLLGIFLVSAAAYAQTASFPTAVASDSQLRVAVNNVGSTITQNIGASDTTVQVLNGVGFAANTVGTIDNEEVAVCAVSGTTLTIGKGACPSTDGRGFDGTAASTHAAGAAIDINTDAWHHNSLKAEVIAIEQALGAGLANVNTAVSPQIQVANYSWTAQTPSDTWTAGASNVVHFAPCPKGLSVNNSGGMLATPVLISGTGTDEAVFPTGGTCTPGASNGTVIFSATNAVGSAVGAHPAGYAVKPASFGLQEALNNTCAGNSGGTLVMGIGFFQLYATVSIPCNNITLQGVSGMCCTLGTTIHRAFTSGDSISIGSNTSQMNGIGIFDIAFQQDLNYTVGLGGACGTITNKPVSGAHIHSWGTVTLNIQRVRLEGMPQNLVITGSAPVTVRDSQFWGLWDAACSADQVTTAGILINEMVSGVGAGIPSYVTLDNLTMSGPLTSAGTYTGASAKNNIEIDACEDFSLINSSLERGANANLLVFPNGTRPLLNVRVHNDKFDSAGTADVILSGDGVQSAQNILISNNLFNCELTGSTALSVPNLSPGAFPFYGLTLTGNQSLACLSTAFNIQDGTGIEVSANNIRAYNAGGSFSTPATASGIYLGGRVTRVVGSGNMIGGGQFLEPYGTGSGHTAYGLSLAAPTGAQGNVSVGWAPPESGSLGFYVPTLTGSCGTGASIAGQSTSNSGTLTTGTGSVSSCTVNFAVPFTHTPSCVVSSAAGGALPTLTPASATLVVTTTATSAPFNWNCQ